MIDNFFQIKSLEAWLDPAEGCILSREHAFVALNVKPSAFGHSLVIPVRSDVYRETDMTPEQLWDFAAAKEEAFDVLCDRIFRDPGFFVDLYRRWTVDPKLQGLGCAPNIEVVLRDLEQGTLDGSGHVFENKGKRAGQMVRQYHRQVVPRFPDDSVIKGGCQAFYHHLHPEIKRY
jgi:diadenosine tetraphosphate (Ap4A) HIT family hydrolase